VEELSELDSRPNPAGRAAYTQPKPLGPAAFWVPAVVITLAVVVGAIWSFSIPPAALFADEQLARLIVFHLPCAFTATLLLIWATYLSVRCLVSKSLSWDTRAASAMELCLIMCILTMLTGILFSRVQWGAWWQWDPRQTSFLLVLLIVTAYFTLRMAFIDENRRALYSAAYVAFSIIPNLFLVFVLPRIMESFHPSDTVIKSKFDGNYWMAILGVFVMMLALSVWLYRLRVRAGLLELALLEAQDAKVDDDSGGTAPTGVVRPIAVSDTGGKES
jgi:heme exporter protein C